MNAERYQNLRELFFAVCDLAPEAREAYLRDACRDEPTLGVELARLLVRDTENAAVLEKHLPEDLRRHLARIMDEYDPDLQRTIGRYRIIRRIGAGGMGSVYEAEQDQPKRRVALKIIRDDDRTEERRRRFEQEAHVLGLLHHPGIAQIYEAGIAQTANGECPFFAMELVEGEPLLAYASTHNLGVDERLVLIAKIAQAVHHAHQKGVIHRDLKPTNILVDEAGEPKVLDFGVARATDLDLKVTTLHTAIGQLIGTVNYMSPEQASGDPREIDTRSDIYSLGVIAFELLSGQLPYDVRRKMVHEVVRMIREDDPSRLSTINRTLRGDVETIVAKALAKEKERRYQAASDLAADINRFLSDEPIIARPPSATYQLRKFARRNRGLVAGVAAAFILLLLGIVGTSYGLVQAKDGERLAKTREKEAEDASALAAERLEEGDRSRRLAEREASRAKAVTTFFREMLMSAGPRIAQGRDLTIKEVVARAAAEVDERYEGDPSGAFVIHDALGRTFFDLGDYKQAEHHHRRAIEILDQIPEPQAADRAGAINNLATALNSQSRLEAALPLYEEALRLFTEALGRDHHLTLTAVGNLGQVYMSLGRHRDALPYLEEAIRGRHTILGDAHPDTILAITNAAMCHYELGDVRLAEKLLTEALATSEEELGPLSTTTLHAMTNMYVVIRETGDFDRTLEWARDLKERSETVYGEDHPRTHTALNSYGLALLDAGQSVEAEKIFEDLVSRRARISGESHFKTLVSIANLINCKRDNSKPNEALAWARILNERGDATLPAGHWQLALFRELLGDCLRETGAFEEAASQYEESYNGLVAAFGAADPRARQVLEQQVNVLEVLGDADRLAEWKAMLDDAESDHPSDANEGSISDEPGL